MNPAAINVLLVTADQFRADCLSVAGHRLVRTPALDALAAEGMRFTRHFGQALPCGPARASILTGMYQMNHRAVRNGTPLDAAFTNLARESRGAGYMPFIIGYTDSSLDPRQLNDGDPQARYEEGLFGLKQYAPGSEHASRDSDWLLHLKELGYPDWNTPFAQKPGYEADTARRGPTYAPSQLEPEHSDTAYTADRAIRFFNQFAGQPWFLHVSFLRPHPPFIAPEPWHEMYSPDDVPDFEALPSLDDEREIHPFMPFRLERLEMNPKLPLDGPHPNDNPAWRQARATYYGLVSEVDHHFGRMVEALRGLGQYENTLIVFTSDHGEMLGDHWCWGKETPFDQATHVPLIIRSPATPAAARGGVVDSFTEHVDLMPTILNAIGVPVPLQCDGRSLSSFLAGEFPSLWRDDVRWEYDFRAVADPAIDARFGCSIDELSFSVVRTDDAKYVHFASLPPLYYDLAADPHELDNRANDPASAQPMLSLAQRMLDWRIAFNRRELTGTTLTRDGPLEADRRRRIV
ncbi:MAG: alkaline phosphatase family protein [Devosia sp.]